VVNCLKQAGIVNAICWHPIEGQNKLCTVSNDGCVLIYDMNTAEEEAIMCYEGGQKINNCAWGQASSNWIGVVYDSKLEALKL
jgi:WD40 repeat protein